ncbi:MAG TPA: chemotaxis protein CheW [Blastocatellia bacterium]|nr:chemotaxis protein CheW [Blastocatellia bacterium]
MIEDKALLSEYLSESEELLDLLLSDLDSLAARSTASPDINLINRIFRTVHSLKGLSGMMDLPEVQSLAHEFEDILDDLRLGHLALDGESTAALQEAGAGLAALVGGAARGTASEEDFERLRQLLTSIATRPRERAKKSDGGLESLALSEKERALLTEYEEHRIKENLKAGRAFYAIVVSFEIGSLDKQYRALTSKLEEKGELITTLPETAPGAAFVAFKLVFATQLRESDVKKIVEQFGGRVKGIGPSSWRRAGAALINVSRIPKKSRQKSGKPSTESISAVLPPAFAQESLQPLSPSVRVDLSQIDELSGLAHELSNEMARLASMAETFLAAAGFGAREQFDLRFSARRIERDFLQLEERLVELRMISLAQTFTRAARLASRLARELGKSVSVEIAGRETQLDKMIVDRVSDSIYHVLRNAIDHGIELPDERRHAGKNARGKIKLEASLEGTRAIIAITDDGRGIDAGEVRRRAVEVGLIAEDEELSEEELLRLIMRPGFSTSDTASIVSGRGVGLDAVERTMHELGGEVRITSEKGKWTRFELAVPTTLVMISAFIVRASEWRYAINVGQIIELMYVRPEEIIGRDGRRSIEWRGSTIPLVELKYLLGLGGARLLHQPNGADALQTLEATQSAAGATIKVPVFITRAADRHVAVAVEQFEEQREIIVKSLGPLARKIKGVVGAVDLEGGDVAIVLDLASLLLLRSLRL